VPGTSEAKTAEPDEKYIVPLGKGRMVQQATTDNVESGEVALIVTYGMGVYWALEASKNIKEKVSILDLRTLNPIDWELIEAQSKTHGRVLVLTEEPLLNSFAESLAGRISKHCFQHLDAPVHTYGAANLPAIPLNVELEKQMLPNAEKVQQELMKLLAY
jgi:2-oxoisovalerate dehydrogenase E1 component